MIKVKKVNMVAKKVTLVHSSVSISIPFTLQNLF